MERLKARSNSGTALITVMLLSVIGLISVAAMMTSLTPVYSKVTQGKQEKMLRAAGEASLDWAISELNKTASGQSGAVADDTTPFLSGSGQSTDTTSVATTAVPSSILTGNGNCAITAFVTVRDTTAPTASYLYDELLDKDYAGSQVTTNGWRSVTATATLGKRTRQIQVILKPTYVTQSSTINITSTQTVAGEPLKVPYASWAMFSRGDFSASGNVETDGYDSRVGTYAATKDMLAGDVGTSGTGTISGNVHIGGDLNVYTGGSGSASASGNAFVRGSVNTNGSSSGFTEGSNTGTSLPAAQQSDSLNINLNNTAPTFPSAPTAPATATNLGAVSISGNSSQTIVGPKDVIVSSLQVSGNGKLIINSSAGPVNIYVQGASGATPISVSGNGISNSGNPTGLRMFYNGNGATSLSGNADFKGMVYAPNSNITVTGNAESYGSLVGQKITMSGNGKFHYDKALGDASVAAYYTVAQQVTSTTTTPVVVTTKTMTDRRVVSWREL